MSRRPSRCLVHLELHTADLASACAFHALLLGWRPERVEAGGGAYWALAIGGEVGGGAVECAAEPPLWLPYVEVPDVPGATERARALGAEVTLEPRRGRGGWRSVVAGPGGPEIALWQPAPRSGR